MVITGMWSPEEDEKLRAVVMQEEKGGHRITWADRARKTGFSDFPSCGLELGLQRSGKSCRRRWVNHLRPGLKRGIKFSPHEATLVLQLQKIYGNKWSLIAAHLEGRTDNDVKNMWHGRCRRLAAAKSTSNCQLNHQQVTLVNDDRAGEATSTLIMPEQCNNEVSLENPVPTLRAVFSCFFADDDYDLMPLRDEEAGLVASS